MDPIKPPLPPKKPGAALPPPLPAGIKKPLVPPRAGEPTVPGIGESSGDLVRVLQRIEEKSQGMVDSKKMLEEQLKQLEQKLHEEREKTLLSTVRSKEEAALSSKIELSLKEMQERLQQEKKSQELEAYNRKLHEEHAALEKKLESERETWMQTLQEQMSSKEHQEQELEVFFTQKLSSLEKKWFAEKNELLARMRSKEEEYKELALRQTAEIEKASVDIERRINELNHQHEIELQDEKEKALQLKRERDMLAEQIESKEQEFITIKAQLALIHSHVKMEKEKLHHSWSEELRIKDQVLKSLQDKIAEGESRHTALLNNKIHELTQAFALERDQLKNQIAEEKKKYADAETINHIALTEEKGKNEYREREILLRIKELESLKQSLADESYTIREAHAQEKAAHEKERTIWKESLREMEQKCLKQKQECDAFVAGKFAAISELQKQVADKDAAIKQLGNDHTALKEEFWNERDTWSSVASAKDSEMQALYARIETLINENKEKEQQYWNEKEKTAELLRSKEIEMSRIHVEHEELQRYKEEVESLKQSVHEKDRKFLEDKEKYTGMLNAQTEEHAKAVRLKDDEIIRVMQEKDKDIMQLSLECERMRINARTEAEKEFQQMLSRADMENREWAERLRKQYEESYAAKEHALKEEIAVIQKRMLQELSVLEQEHNREKDLLRKELEKKTSDMRYPQSPNNDKAAANSETAEKKMSVLEQLQRKADETSHKQQEELHELQDKFNQDILSLEQKINRAQQPKTLLGKIWAYLNRTVIVISFKHPQRIG